MKSAKGKVLKILILLAISASARAASVNVAWNANAEGDLSGYRLYTAEVSLLGMTPAQALAAGAVFKIIPAPATTTVANNLALGATTYFRLTAFNTAGEESDFCDLPTQISTYVPPAPPSAPPAPTLTSANAVSNTQVDLAWNYSGAAPTGFYVDRSLTPSGTVTTITLADPAVRTYSDTGRTAGTTYYYRVRAYNGVGPSTASNQLFATTPGGTVASPTGVTAHADSTSQITVSWSYGANPTGFYIDWSLTPGGTVFTITVAGNVRSYPHMNLPADTGYYYRVRAFTTGTSAPSSQAFAKTLLGGFGSSNTTLPERQILTPGRADNMNDVAVFGPQAEEAEIIDARGRKVGRGALTPLGLAWDCKEDGGVTAPSGLYIAKVKGRDGSVRYQKLLIVK